MREDIFPSGNGHFLEEESTRELLTDLRDEVKTLVREELRLVQLETEEARGRLREDVDVARHEVEDGLKQTARGAGTTAVGGLLMQCAILVLLFGLAFGIATTLPLWASLLIVGAGVLLLAALLMWGGVGVIKRAHVVPRRALNRLKEDGRWISERMRALGSQDRANV